MNETDQRPKHNLFTVGDWLVATETGHISRGQESVRLEPKVMDLLVLLSQDAGTVYSRVDIEKSLWGNVIVGEDTVARAISKLRRALNDSAQNPVYIETLTKRGYRLLVSVGTPKNETTGIKKTRQHIGMVATMAILAIVVVGIAKFEQATPESKSQASALTARADDLYMKFTRSDNEAAIALYERVLANNTDYAPAQSGLANALVQRVIRWPSGKTANNSTANSIQEALQLGLNRSVESREILDRATAMAERASRLAPKDADALKALGLAYSAQGQLAAAETVYLQAIDIDQNAWESMINLAEINQINNKPEHALKLFVDAFEVMDSNYENEPQRIGPWQAALGVLIASKYEKQNQRQDAELWYRRVLDKSPLEPEATTRLANILRLGGDHSQADQLCDSLAVKTANVHSCERSLAP